MTQWLADENFKEEILDGVWLRLPGAQIVKAKEIGLVSADDPTVLDVAATQQRILLTHDQRTSRTSPMRASWMGSRCLGLWWCPGPCRLAWQLTNSNL
jgi:hypothetical protein